MILFTITQTVFSVFSKAALSIVLQPLILQEPIMKYIMVHPPDFHLLPPFSFVFHPAFFHNAPGAFIIPQPSFVLKVKLYKEG